MATFRGECEPLHGHNYDIIIELEGELSDDGWVWDFGELKREAKEDARSAKEREKGAKRRAKEEKKLQKKERKQGPPSDEDEN